MPPLLLQELLGECEGYLCIKQAWPSTIRTIFGDQERYEMTYFAPFKVHPRRSPPISDPIRQSPVPTASVAQVFRDEG